MTRDVFCKYHWDNFLILEIVYAFLFSHWSAAPNYKSPDWWSPYNKVKHDRLLYYKDANLKNVLNALAALCTSRK